MKLSRTLSLILAASCGLGTMHAMDATAASPRSQDQFITLETTEKPLDVVLQWISRRAGINIVTNVDAAGSEMDRVTMRLVNVTWQEAVEQIARRYDYVIEKRSDRIWELTKPPKVRMEFQNALLRVVLDALSRQANVNIVISDSIDASRRITMKMNDVPWREALDVIIKTTGYVWIEQDYQIIRVVAPEDIETDLETRVFPLNYTDALNAQTIIQVALSANGQVGIDQRTNTLIVTDTAVSLQAAADILRRIDVRNEEVQIEMKFVEFDSSDTNAFGFGAAFNYQDGDIGNITGALLPFSPFPSQALNVVGNPINFGGGVSGALSLEAVSTLTSSEVLSAPSVLTTDNTEATIEIVEVVRWAEQDIAEGDGEGDAIVALEEGEGSPLEVGMKIKVTPHITSDGFVSMSLDVTDETVKNPLADDAVFTGGSIYLPQVRRKSVKTDIMVADGDTAVIGGMISNQVSETEHRVPVLGSIPVLGHLFRRTDENTIQRNLTIFITPEWLT